MATSKEVAVTEAVAPVVAMASDWASGWGWVWVLVLHLAATVPKAAAIRPAAVVIPAMAVTLMAVMPTRVATAEPVQVARRRRR